MTTNIDSSLRRAILPENTGDTVPDSVPLLADDPKLVMEPGVSRPVYRFDDGDGLTDAFGNVYDGYGSGGNSSTFTIKPADSISDEVDIAEDGDLIQFNATRQLYEPKTIEEAGLARVGGATPTDGQQLFFNFANEQYEPGNGVQVSQTTSANDGDVLQYDGVNNEYEPKSIEAANLARVGGNNPTDGDILVFNSTFGDFRPEQPSGGGGGTVTITDFISGTIEIPQNKSYILVDNLPYDITITNTFSQTETGNVNVSFPTGTRAQGTNLQIQVTSADGEGVDEFLRFQIDFTREITI